MSPGILGKKIGMTQVFRADGQVVPVTVLKAGPCVVTQRKTPAIDGYDAVQLGLMEYVKKSRINKPDAALFNDCRAEADDKLNAINKSGDIAEGVGGYIAAQVVRGAWLASLNNEAVAKLVTTLISVSARKGTELAFWTAQQCQNNVNALQMRTVRIVTDP